MKAMQKIFIAVAAAILAAASAQATMYWARPHDPNLQRWITRDPIGELGGINVYQFVANDPINEFDPLGLATAVIIGGQASRPGEIPNPFGHASIAFTGNGIYSFGTGSGKDFGLSFTDFLNNQAKYRDSTVYILNTTPEQEQAMIAYLKKLTAKPLQKYPDNCARRTTGALSAGGIDLTQISLASPIGLPLAEPIDNFPRDIAFALSAFHPLKISVPKGTVLPPKFLTGFNPK